MENTPGSLIWCFLSAAKLFFSDKEENKETNQITIIESLKKNE